jgi:hypothetical protein
MSDFDNIDWSATHVKCHICGEMIPRGIISVSAHYCDNHYQPQMYFLQKLAENKSLDVKDKMDLVKKEFGIDQ